MTPHTRRSALRLGAGLALATALAGCSDDEDAENAASSGTNEDDDDSPFPGVEDGVVARVEPLGEAHEEALRSRSGTLVETYLNAHPADDAATVTTGRTRVDGDRLHAVTMPVGGNGNVDREEFYAEDGTTWMATFADGEATSVDPDDRGTTEHDLLGRGYVQESLWEASVVGTASDGDDRYVVRREGTDEAVEEWAETVAVVDSDGLVHRFGHDADRGEGGDEARVRRDVRLTDLDATTVERPEWVDEA